MPIVNAASEDTARRSAVPSLKPDKKSRNVRFSFFRFSMRSDSRILRDRGLSEAKRREKAKRRPRQERRPIPSGIFLVSSAAAIPPSAKNSVSPPAAETSAIPSGYVKSGMALTESTAQNRAGESAAKNPRIQPAMISPSLL